MNTKTIVLIILVAILDIIGGFLYFLNFRTSQNISGNLPIEATIEEAGTDYNSGNIDGSISKSEAITAKANQNTLALLLLAASYAEKGSVSFSEENYGQKAIDTANKVLAIDPNNSEAYRIIGYANEIMQKYDEARKNYDKAIVLDPKNSQALSNKGHSYDLQGDLKNAEIWYDKALAINPNDEHALLNKARVLAREKKSEEAKDALDTLLDTSKNSRFLAEADQVYAFVLMNETPPDYDGALEAIGEGIKFDSTIPQAWVTLAMIKLHSTINLATKNELAAAIAEVNAALEKALKINPNQASAYYIGSEAANLLGDKSKSVALKQKALDAIPKDITLGANEKKELKATIESSNVK